MTEGVRIRYTRLNQVCRKALQQSVTKIQNWEKLASCFPTYTATDAGTRNLNTCQKQVVEFWMELSKREFDEIFRERDIERKLNELDDLISRAKTVQKGLHEEHTDLPCIDELTPEQLISGNIHDARTKLIGQLGDRVTKVSNINGDLELELQKIKVLLDNESQQLEEILDRNMGHDSDTSDEMLQRGLRDMLLELREEQEV
ncbi:LAME_0A01860g1_1 [Lachancea meyersii CBS 8951]|uniref:Kinetochore-associated protein n=1 Tax=Lachancea meyersii CBS 8951 TaxID=1266667 RepID=A0A1G4IM68_9SACH|nr:LAME_0A01860g1_1 [Lachancea meyersii CBS 8951]